jgi:DNA-binding winged helix-turn-helix (wHTH) protein
MEAPAIVALEAGEVDLVRGVVRRAHGVHQLTLHQLDLLRYLVARPGAAVSREEILREAWGWRGAVLRTRATDFAVLRIRACIERDPHQPRHLLTNAGTGYRFDPLPEGAPRSVLVQPPGARHDTSWYAPRPAQEREAAAHLGVPGSPLVFTGPRGFGKTWLLQRVLGAAVTPEDLGVEVDLDACDGTTLASTDAVTAHLGLALAEAADLPPERWEAACSGPGSAFHRLTRFVEREVLPTTTGRLVLVIDHADRLRAVPGGATVFGLLRAWASRTRAPWERLRLVLAVSTEPALLVDAAISPFNLSSPVPVPPFDRTQIAWLVDRHGLAAAWVDPITTWTAGHPTLARQACHAAATSALALDGFEAAAESGGVFAEHLRSRLVRLQARPELGAAVRDVLAWRVPDPGAAERLVAAGLIVRADVYRLQNPLYARFFGRWA